MKIAKLMVLAMVMTWSVAGCGGHSEGYRHGDPSSIAERGSKEMMAIVEKAVPDPEKTKRVQQVVNEMMNEAGESYKLNRAYHQKLYELNANYSATPEEFTRILDDLNNVRARSGARILVLRFKMKEMLTADEWKALTDGLAAARARYLQGHEGAEGGKSGY